MNVHSAHQIYGNRDVYIISKQAQTRTASELILCASGWPTASFMQSKKIQVLSHMAVFIQ